MCLTFNSTHYSNSQLQLHHPELFKGVGVKEYDYDVNGKCAIQEKVFEGAGVYLTTIDQEAPCRVQIKCSRFCWLMSFVLEGNVLIRFGKKLTLMQGEQLIYPCETLNAAIIVERSTRVLSVCLTSDFVKKFIIPDQLKYPEYDKRITDPKTGIILTAMLDDHQPASTKRLFLEAKVLELLATQLAHFSNRAPANGLSKLDTERLQDAKAILTQNLKDPCTLMELARRAGLNDFKLKKGFKTLFGNTVFGYLFQLRMETAYTLLQSSKSVSEVAEAVGYKNAHHFTAAFKKQFGFLPSQLNKMNA